MFVHAPEESAVTVNALVLWDDPDLAYHAVEICRGIEHRVDDVKFHIEQAEARDLASRAEEIRRKACEADVFLVALHRTVCEQPFLVQSWFEEWAQARDRQSGALAVLRPSDHVNCEQFRRLVSRVEEQFPDGSEAEWAFRQFLEKCARQAHMEFFSGTLESDLEEATRGFRILQAPGPPARFRMADA